MPLKIMEDKKKIMLNKTSIQVAMYVAPRRY